MHYYSYETFKKDTGSLIEQSRQYRPDAIVAIARGGLMLGQLMGYGLGVRNVQSIRVESYDGQVQRKEVAILGHCDLENAERILIVDDIVDSGHTLRAILDYFDRTAPQAQKRSASLFYKSSASVLPDYRVREANAWINFFWEHDYA
jgi:xanthine phosphoribosyltransferase